MKGIATLIRLAKRNLDELRKQQVALENEKAKLLQAIRTLDSKLQSEQALAAKSPEMATFYGEFAKRIKERQAVLRGEVKAVEEKLVKISEEITEAFAELKKYEIARDNAAARAKAEAARKETIAFDEIAATQFMRKEKEES
ncbi:MAG: flagellar FliJ family protein [Alphaproteobacteria bacterium]|nr:flagellar FliJ family protein [Alphaproteobacteria bacterium]